MRLSWQTDYALRILLFLGSRSKRATAAEVASFFNISKDHVAKVMQRLAKLGYARTVRGLGGGIELAREAADIRLGDVIEAMEGRMCLLDCVVVDNICVIQPGCRLRGVLAKAESIQRDYLNSVTLAHILDGARDLVSWTSVNSLVELEGEKP